MLASGHSHRETYLRLKISESQFHRDWKAISKFIQDMELTSVEDYQLLVQYQSAEILRLEAEVSSSDARVTSLMDTASDAVFLVKGRTGEILKANNQALLMFGYSPREIIGKPMEMLIEADLRSKHGALRTGFLNSSRKRELGYHPPIYALKHDGTSIKLDIALTATKATDDVMVVCRLSCESDLESPTEYVGEMS